MPASASASASSRPTSWAGRRMKSRPTRHRGSSGDGGGIDTCCGRWSCTFPFLFGLFSLRLLANVAYHYWTMPPKQVTPKVVMKSPMKKAGDDPAVTNAEESSAGVEHRRISSDSSLSSALGVDLGDGAPGRRLRGGGSPPHDSDAATTTPTGIVEAAADEDEAAAVVVEDGEGNSG